MAVIVSPLFPQAQVFSVSTGVKGQTYSKMFSELSAQCQGEQGIRFFEKESVGSMENLDRILNNEVTAAIVQVDVLHSRRRLDDLSGIKVLLPLHPEEVHLVVRSAPRKEGGLFGTKFLAKEISFLSLADMRGRVLGTWGGGLVTAQMINLHTGINLQIQEFANSLDATKALDEGRVDVVLSVGGAPISWIQELNRDYKLLTIGVSEATKLQTIYRVARVSYPNLSQSGVQTIATDALMVTRDYKTDTMVSMLGKVRHCFKSNLPALQERPGNHIKWHAIKVDSQPKWPLYQPPQ